MVRIECECDVVGPVRAAKGLDRKDRFLAIGSILHSAGSLSGRSDAAEEVAQPGYFAAVDPSCWRGAALLVPAYD
jgi:hypothetical protein